MFETVYEGSITAIVWGETMMNLPLLLIACLVAIQPTPKTTDTAKAVASEQTPSTITEALKEAVLKAAVVGERGRLCQAQFSSADAASRHTLLEQAKVRDRIIELRKQQADLDAKARQLAADRQLPPDRRAEDTAAVRRERQAKEQQERTQATLHTELTERLSTANKEAATAQACVKRSHTDLAALSK